MNNQLRYTYRQGEVLSLKRLGENFSKTASIKLNKTRVKDNRKEITNIKKFTSHLPERRKK